MEEQFYLLFPLLMLGWMRLSLTWRAGLLVLAGLGSLGLAGALVGQYPNEVFYLLPFRAWELLAGAALAVGLLPAATSSFARWTLLASPTTGSNAPSGWRARARAAGCLARRHRSPSRCWAPLRRPGLAGIQAALRCPGCAAGRGAQRAKPLPGLLRAAPGGVLPAGPGRQSPRHLLWGDSHALSWAPALEAALAATGRSALLVSTAGCPPVIDMRNRINPHCQGTNAAVQALVVQHPQIRTVVLSGFWSTYFREAGPIHHLSPSGRETGGAEGAARALDATLQAQGMHVVLLGPVPVYARSVPAALALEIHTGRMLRDRSRQAQEDRHRLYSATADALRAKGVQVLDPVAWLSPGPQCRVEAEGMPLYEDEHHMSPAGALSVLRQVAAAMEIGPDQGPADAAPAS